MLPALPADGILAVMRTAATIALALALAACEGESHRITAEEYGAAWPFDGVKLGYLACFGRDRQTTFEADINGRRVAFALNVAAEYAGYPPIASIVAPGGDVQQIRDKAARRCPQPRT